MLLEVSCDITGLVLNKPVKQAAVDQQQQDLCCVILLHWSCVKKGSYNPTYSGTIITGARQSDLVAHGSRLTEQLAILSKVFWHKTLSARTLCDLCLLLLSTVKSQPALQVEDINQ